MNSQNFHTQDSQDSVIHFQNSYIHSSTLNLNLQKSNSLVCSYIGHPLEGECLGTP